MPILGPTTRSKSFQNKKPRVCRSVARNRLKTRRKKLTMQRAILIETMAALTGVTGATLVAIPGLTSWGFVAFLLSNVGWLAFSRANGHWRMFAQQLVFLATSLLGLWNWWLAPLMRG
jgi:hypothetical protein